MSNTQSIIVYRNPLEQQFWEGSAFGGNLFPVMVGVVAFFIFFLSLNRLLCYVFRNTRLFARSRSSDKVAAYAAIAVAAGLAIVVSSIMWV